jgi:putative transcriptional regulator
MTNDGAPVASTGVLKSKRDATRYGILVEIADRQPAVNQQEIADAIDVTPQAVSDYLKGLIEEGYVEKHGRGRYEVTKEGVDWLISQTDALRGLIEHVSAEVIGQVDVETAIAATDIEEGQAVSLTMRDGVLHAIAGEGGSAGGTTAIAVRSAPEGRDVGVTNFEGVLDYELGSVTIVPVPPIREGGSAALDLQEVADAIETHDLLAVSGTEALAALRALEVEPDVRFGTAAAIREAAAKGIDIVLVAVATTVASHTNELRELNVGYEVLDTRE